MHPSEIGNRLENIQWTINDLPTSDGCVGINSLVLWNICSSPLYGGWDDINLEFQNIGNIHDNSEFTFTMYYQLVPVTAI